MRTDRHRLCRVRYSRRDTPAERCKNGDSNDGTRQDTCQHLAAIQGFHCVLLPFPKIPRTISPKTTYIRAGPLAVEIIVSSLMMDL